MLWKHKKDVRREIITENDIKDKNRKTTKG